MDKINLIFLDVKNSGENFLDGIKKSPDFNVISKVSTLDTLANAMRDRSQSKSPVLLCIYCSVGVFVPPDILSYLSTAKLKSIAVCESAQQGFELLKHGVTDMIVFDNIKSGFFFKSFASRARTVVSESGVSRILKRDFNRPVRSVIAIGASTGGTEAVVKILEKFPEEMPPILLTQHMPPIFTNLFAKRLNSICKLTVWEAKDGDELKNGLLLVAPGNRQMALDRRSNRLIVNCTDENLVSGHCPSVDVLFSSVASIAGKDAIGVILTGMGADGAKGLLKMFQAKAHTIGQDPNSCVVYGMPKAAFDIGAVGTQIPLDRIADDILRHLTKANLM